MSVVLFDLGGVLTPDPWETLLLTPRIGLADRLGIDSSQAAEAANRLFQSYAVRRRAEEAEFWDDLGGALGVEVPLELVLSLEREVLKPNPEARTVLGVLSACGVRVGVISNTTSFWFDKQAEMTELAGFADEQLLFLSFRLGVRKGDVPGLFELAAEATDPRLTLIVDDREEHVAHAAGLGFNVLSYTLGPGRSLLKELERTTRPSQKAPIPLTEERASRVLQPMLAEYEALREESLASLSHRMTVMNFAFGALAVVIAGLLTRRVSDALAGVIAILFVPQIAKAALLIWLGEYERSRRAGRWLVGLERRINAVAGDDAIGWEKSLWEGTRESTKHMGYPYVAVVVLLLGAAYASMALGLYYLAAEIRAEAGTAWAIAAGAVILPLVVGAEAVFVRFFLAKWEACRARTGFAT